MPELAAEALRYLGADDSLRPDAEKMLASLNIQPRWRWKLADGLILPGETAKAMLHACRHSCILIATLGEAFDAKLRAMQARDMAKAVLMDACGSALVEHACDEAEKEIAARFEGMHLTDRFSPGYGDLPLSVQEELCRTMDAARTLGVHMAPSFMLQPFKTVTAIIGIANTPQPMRIRGCEYCSLRERCAIHKGGKRCAL